MFRGQILSFILLLVLSHEAFSALGRFQQALMGEASCLVEIKKMSGAVLCSANHIGDGFFKTAAHCFDKAEAVRLFCQNSEPLEVDLPAIHPQFSIERVGYKLGERLYDLAIFDTKGELAHLPYGEIPKSWQETRNIILEADSCFFSGFGVNQWNQRLGSYKETQVPPRGLEQTEDFLTYNNFLQFTVMAGDSGGSVYCLKGSKVFDIGSSSGKDFSQRSLMISSYKVLKAFSLNLTRSNFRVESPSRLIEAPGGIRVGETYRVKTFSLLYDLENDLEVLGNGDNWKLEFEVNRIQGDYALGNYVNHGVSVFYLCSDGMICDARGEAKILLRDLISE